MVGGRLYDALYNDKNDVIGEPAQKALWSNLTSLLWRFIAAHERCIARAAGTDGFDIVCTVTSKDPTRPERPLGLQTIVGRAWVDIAGEPTVTGPLNARYERLLVARPLVDPATHPFDPNRFEAVRRLDGLRVLLVEDTWVTGGAARSAAWALKDAGASIVACTAIGRRLQADWAPPNGGTGKRFKQLPATFDWGTCAVHDPPPAAAPPPTSPW